VTFSFHHKSNVILLVVQLFYLMSYFQGINQ